MTCQTSGPTLNDCREVLARLRRAAYQAVELVCQGDPAERVISEMESIASEANLLLRDLLSRHGEGQSPEVDVGPSFTEVRELLAESLRQLRTAQEYAKVVVQGLQRELEEAAQGQKGLRAYQAARVDRPQSPG